MIRIIMIRIVVVMMVVVVVLVKTVVVVVRPRNYSSRSFDIGVEVSRRYE